MFDERDKAFYCIWLIAIRHPCFKIWFSYDMIKFRFDVHVFHDPPLRRMIFPMLWIRDVYPGSWILPIPDPRSRIQKQQQKRGEKKYVAIFFCSQRFHQIELFCYWNAQEKIWASFHRIIELLPKNLSLTSQKYGFGIRKKPIPDLGPWVNKAPDPDPKHWIFPIKQYMSEGRNVLCRALSAH